jgi:hypothetical protein
MEDQPVPGSWPGAADGEAPPPFVVSGSLAVPMNAAKLDLVIEADAAQRRAVGRARLKFALAEKGKPLLDLVPHPTRVLLDGQPLPPERLRLVLPPDESTPLRMLDEVLTPGEGHVLEIEYPLRDDTVGFDDGGVQLGLFMTDLDQRGYLERHAPANLEFDQVPMTVEIHLSGASGAHRLFSNARVAAGGGGVWRVEFPDYFTCSSCYLHLTNRPVSLRDASFTGLEGEIPITAYGKHPEEVERALGDALGFLRELEETYGPYPHEALLIHCTGEVSGGMEYAGAAMTSLGALGHEITHSWFARGVMPANGNAGWIDEAIARWRDLGYPRASATPVRPPVNLAGFSPYRRHTPRESYARGSLLLSEMDALFGGLRPILAKLFLERRRQLITTPLFQAFLERETGMSLESIFSRYVYGKEEEGDRGHVYETIAAAVELFDTAGIRTSSSPPPRAFTRSELRSLL